MKIFDSESLRALDQQTIQEDGLKSYQLMERAAERLTQKLLSLISPDKSISFICGPGNNGGDGLAMARMCYHAGRSVIVFLLDSKDYSYDNRLNQNLLEGLDIQIRSLSAPDAVEMLEKSDLIVDALFGSGLSRPITGELGKLVLKINDLKTSIISIDMPSGLFDEVIPEGAIIKASRTLAIQFPRRTFFSSEANAFVGHWELIDIGLSIDGISKTKTDTYLLDHHELIDQNLPVRPVFGHKGTFGHAVMITGSRGMFGASVLSTLACLKSGCGLVTAHVPQACRDIIHLSCPEALMSEDLHIYHVSESPDNLSDFSAIGIGCGLGKNMETTQMLDRFLSKIDDDVPVVFDADAINIIAENKWLERLPNTSVLTPHPGEFARLIGKKLPDWKNWDVQREMAVKSQIVIVLKGHHTTVALPDGRFFYNQTGNNGMATGGSGDVLTGLLTGLLAQWKDSSMAALCAVYLHGLAADLKLKSQSPETLLARDIIDGFGEAFHILRS